MIYKDIEYSYKTSRRKTASVYIERDGTVSLIVPNGFSQVMVEEVIEKKLNWLYTGMAEWESMNAARIKREYVNGESFLYLGMSYRLEKVSVDKQVEPLVLKGEYFYLLDYQSVDPAKAFEDFYRTKAKKLLKERIELYEGQMGLKSTGLKVMELQNRWASCSANGNLNFHWKCMMAPLTVLDYIVVHELAHITHPTHNEAFWNEVDKVLPDYHSRKNWLKQYGASMEL
ncbi:MAG: M48 family metallopeptidase [Lentisphaeraceae bacterium]|nr:M48 family metallopeptidase [Lentisphaeraceae bacterium]